MAIPDEQVEWPDWPHHVFVDGRRVTMNAFTTVDWVVWEPFDPDADPRETFDTGLFYTCDFDGMYVGTWSGMTEATKPPRNMGDGYVFKVQTADGGGGRPGGTARWVPVVRDQLAINPDGGFAAGTRIDGDVLLPDLETTSGSGFKQVLIGPDGKLYRAA